MVLDKRGTILKELDDMFEELRKESSERKSHRGFKNLSRKAHGLSSKNLGKLEDIYVKA
jgi:hypothetical protein